MSKEWLVINIMLPQKPSAVRVSVWRKLKTAGAVSIGQSAWVLPYSEAGLDCYNEIKCIADKSGGKAFISKSDFLQTPDSRPLEDYFNAERDTEYKELLEHCEFLLCELQKETEKKNFTFAELEENEQELEKLDGWFGKIAKRDFFGAKRKTQSENELKKCRVSLSAFSESVYADNNLSGGTSEDE